MSDKKILSAIPLNGTTYTAGMEDELAKVIPADRIEYLTEQGAIEGFSSKAADKPEKETGKKK